MNYVSMKVKDAMLKITQNEIYLPAIQRRFVWDTEKIEKLFDSIMRGYPIGTFLFWFLKTGAKDEYTFYKFIQDFHERDRALNDIAPKPDLREEFIGVLDGQQRLNSMYVALQGSYAYRRKHGRRNDDSAFPQRFLYLNLFYQPASEDESGVAYQFSFLTPQEAMGVDETVCWFRVKDILAWADPGPVFTVISEAVEKHPLYKGILVERCGPLLNKLWSRLCVEDVINYFSIQDQVLDNVVHIFVRVNSAGVQLSKTDLLFSSIVAHWDEGRANIESLIQTLNDKGNRFTFDNDFVMRCCLVLTDLKILFKVNSFKKENIELIKTNWPKIKEALETMVDLLVEWGFCSETLPALNAVIPIAYFAFKDGDVDSSKGELRQYLIRALLNQIFGSQTDRVLGAIRDHLRIEVSGTKGFVLKRKNLELAELLNAQLPDQRTFRINDEDIEDCLLREKGAYTFIVLSLLYPHLKFDQIQFHQDHIHPKSQFGVQDLKKLGLVPEQIEQFQINRDRLPNLQLMEGAENKSKNATPFNAWIRDFSNEEREHFVKSNMIPSGESFEFKDFASFYDARKELLRKKLKAVLT